VTPEQQALFSRQGYLYLPGSLDKSAVRPVKTHIQEELKRLNVWASGRVLSNRLKGVPLFQQVGKLGQLISYPCLKDRLISPYLLSCMHKLAGAGLTPEHDAQLLLSLPLQGEWTLAGLNWHRDISGSRLAKLPGVQAFVLIDELAQHGGATLALAGSHRLKKQFRGSPNIDKLLNNSSDGRLTVDDMELSVVEMTGRAGDVYLMDMRLLHTPSINATKQVRMMATIRYFIPQIT
jgi:hypothetical protein